jgi:acyl-CoA synthetase (AMP-forming)/AMP-acid ligase II
MESDLWRAWQKIVRRGRSRVVVIDAASGREWTADELTRRALELAARMTDFRRGQRIAFQLPNGGEWLAFFLALQERGLAAMPLDAGLPVAGCLEMARRLRARACFAHGKIHELDCDAPRTRAALVKVTSGSSDTPKAIACRAAHLLADGRHVAATMGIRANDRNLAVIPLGHSYGVGNLVMPLILQGTAAVCAADYLPRQLVEWIARYRVTVFPGVPALFRVLGTLPAGAKMTGLRTAISAGAMLGAETAAAFYARFGVKIHNFYGSSETGGISYDRTGDASLTGRSVGRPLRGVKVTVRDGRITVASDAVATAARKWRLPDLGEWNRRGELVLLGRVGQGANIGGRKAHPLEIERALRAIAGVSDAHVWIEHRQGRDSLAAAVEARLARGAIEHALAAKLPAWKMPKYFVIAPELPRTARGKPDVARLKERVHGAERNSHRKT